MRGSPSGRAPTGGVRVFRGRGRGGGRARSLRRERGMEVSAGEEKREGGGSDGLNSMRRVP